MLKKTEGVTRMDKFGSKRIRHDLKIRSIEIQKPIWLGHVVATVEESQKEWYRQ